MINRCPPNWTGNDSLPLLCQRNPNLTEYSHLLDLPVFSLATNRSYANIYCAKCHFDTRHLAKWDLSVNCPWKTSSYVIIILNFFANFFLLMWETNPFYRHSIEKITTPSNYRRGTRKWFYKEDNETTSLCYMIVEQFRNYNQFIEVEIFVSS